MTTKHDHKTLGDLISYLTGMEQEYGSDAVVIIRTWKDEKNYDVGIVASRPNEMEGSRSHIPDAGPVTIITIVAAGDPLDASC